MRFAVFAAVLAVSSLQAIGAESPTEITEADFLAALDEDHPAFAALEEVVGIARAAEVRARTFDNPAVEIAREDPSGPTGELELTVGWQLPRPALRRLSIDAAGRETDAARSRLAADRLAVRLELRRAFAEWAAATVRAALLTAQVERTTELAERERRRAERGESSGLEARRLTLAAAEASGRLAVAEAEAERARAFARGWRPDLPAGATPVLPALPDVSHLAATAHPRIAALEAELAAARLARDAADYRVGWPRLVAGWKQERDDGMTVDGPVLGLAWSLPIADRRQAERIQAAARVEAAEARLELASRQIDAERDGAAAAYERLSTAAAEMAAANAANTQMIEAAAAAFRLGEAGLTDLLEVLRATAEAELTALELHASALAAHRDLEAAYARGTQP